MSRAYAAEIRGNGHFGRRVLAMPDGAIKTGAVKRGRLVQRRKAMGLTQEQLAELLGVERTTVVRWERGQTQPQPWLQPRLARALRVSADHIEELLAADGVLASSLGPAAAVPRQLPPAVADFTGRAAELRALTRMLEQDVAGAPGTVVISAIGGTAGVGKTALALRWAHQVAHRFPDGQLHVNLRGFDPSGAPVAPEAAIRGFLDTLGVPSGRIPAGPEEQAGLYRSLLAGRKVLIVLDNARDEQQVRPLLPASPGSLVLVTSRSQLSGLAAADGALLVSLDVLPHAEAVHMLTTRLGAARAAAEPAAVDQIASLCACLPLALAVATARAAARPGFPLAVLADELRDVAGRLDALDVGDPGSSVRAVFSWSYHQLGDEAARMFRLLGIHPGPDITAHAAASLVSRTQPQARGLIRELVRAHLIAEHVPGRYAFHDLLRAYATNQARATEDGQAREAATGRALDHYLHTAHTAALLIAPSRDPITSPPPRPGVTPEHLAGHPEALAWLQAEHQVLLTAIALAASTRFDVHAWQIPCEMGDFLNRQGRWHELATIQRIAVMAATRLDDRPGQAMSLRNLGMACLRLGDHEQALAHYTASLRLYQQLGDRLGQANIHQLLGAAAESHGRYADALSHAEQALRFYQAVGHRRKEAGMLNNVGFAHALLGDYRQARLFSERALELAGQLRQRDIEAYASDSLGYAEYHLGHLAEAAASYQRALSLFREFGNLDQEATILDHLGDARHAAGEVAQARDAWQQALVIFDDLQQPSADQVRAKLASTNDHPSSNLPA
jgi:tetratricopeptide (TPR) repeat protein/transcriptional regulator with XRE-family HTH domain